ncbi:uncharacterized protein Z520_11493 [Fonsecaea multimorphosa CBS 102226]|uniref:Uncharacterized protein n=1 Tax=Fonsecaea multimorphosa CBS 102226 TaxID=1442371 RepID=A0A0D2GTN7_9EURO|nr:uncharacterized protein Z520_11493 [Fonsecaea multimorphosa CBS 102226]KIX92830.1 hypothetical protein Z520_11493 [Fonsecaea multimorphosa CBS 102226]OAL18078.1 hypothetical protein AYO22_11000 [Fonsecaea multimorphosa]
MGGFRDLWLRWKMLRLPWRKRFLVGQDLYGNTFWEFKDALNHNRWRRMVKGRRRATLSSLSDVQISPQWHQWLRQTRHDPPTLQEQAADVQRQAQLKINARMADERWAAKARYIEKPKPSVITPLLSGDPQQDRARAEHSPGQPRQSEKMSNSVESNKDQQMKSGVTGSNPGANWAPDTWVPSPKR